MKQEETATDEAENLVDGVVDDGRTKIIQKHEKLVTKAVEELDNFREFNAVVSEIRRRLDDR